MSSRLGGLCGHLPDEAGVLCLAGSVLLEVHD